MRSFLLTLCLTFLLVSCNSGEIYSKRTDEFKLNRWEKTTVLNHEFTIDNSEKNYQFTIDLSHVYEFQFEKAPLLVTITNPNGISEKIPVSIPIKNKNGKELGDCMGDFCDIHHTFKSNAKLEKGLYKVAISHEFENTYLPNIICVGLTVSEQK